MVTQQGCDFQVGDGADPEIFSTLADLYEIPEIKFKPKTLRDATDVIHAKTSDMKKYEFSKQMDGEEITISCGYIPSDTAQSRLIAQEGENGGVNMQFSWTDGASTQTRSFKVLVVNTSIVPSASNDSDAKDMINFTLKIHDVVPTLSVS